MKRRAASRSRRSSRRTGSRPTSTCALKWSLDADEAADLTQEFFTSTLEKEVVEKYDPARARFRTYLRLCLDGFASNARKAERRLKRGGGVTMVPLDFETAEGEMADARARGRRRRRRAVLSRMGARAARTLGRRSQAPRRSAGRPDMFEVFSRYDLVDEGETRPTYTAIAVGVESDGSDRDEPSRGDAPPVPEDRARSAARADLERRGVGSGSGAAARTPFDSRSIASRPDRSLRTSRDFRSRDRSPARCGVVARARCAIRDHRRRRLRRHGHGLRRARSRPRSRRGGEGARRRRSQRLARARGCSAKRTSWPGSIIPGIVPVHDAGTLEDGRAFYVMKLVKGRRLDDLIRDRTAAREPADGVRSHPRCRRVRARARRRAPRPEARERDGRRASARST